jgi:type I restriction enzyme R subunit
MEGKYKNRYDVTILINGLPLVQVELKRRGIEIMEAFNQICRYHKHSYKGLFKYIQIFVVSNGVNTKYFANNRILRKKQTFYWTDTNNKKYSELHQFTDEFLPKCHLAKMIVKYIVLHQSDKALMILRPYQYYAVEKIVKEVKLKTGKNGYVWHTTGSGKTLTSFKASQILITDPDVDKVIFAVDRRDLDYQTTKEYNAFEPNSVDGTENTQSLLKQLKSKKTKLIVTTIQKLNIAVTRKKIQIEGVAEKRVVVIYDECHRNQFGKTHKFIKEFFNNAQFFGFTGTPILAKNSIKNKTTEDIFEQRLHTYTIKDAIDDDNVLGFSVDYYNTIKDKDDDSNYDLDEDQEVTSINTKEAFHDERRLNLVVDYILDNHDKKTYNREFNAIFAVDSIELLLKYYKIFQEKQKGRRRKLKIATIFTYQANQDLTDSKGEVAVEEEQAEYNSKKVNQHHKDALETIVGDYLQLYGTKVDLNKANGFNSYRVDIQKRVISNDIDILLVVSMFLTGFDSKITNTLYVDRNLQYHGLIQAFSRTNRILNDKKRYGNIVCFRPLKKKTDDAITLYSNENSDSKVLMQAYEHYVDNFNHIAQKFLLLVPSPDSVDNLVGEEAKAKFIKLYRDLLREMNLLITFSQFTYSELDIDNQTFEEYKSKYLDLYESEKHKSRNESASILDDIDFELELLRRDNINVDYILELLANLDQTSKTYEQDKEKILKQVENSEQLRSKLDLIQEFISNNKQGLTDIKTIKDKFDDFCYVVKEREISGFVKEHELKRDRLEKALKEFEWSGNIDDNLVKRSLTKRVGIVERTGIINIIKEKIVSLADRFNW